MRRVFNIAKQVFYFLNKIRPTLVLILLVSMLWKDIWTIREIMGFIFLCTLFLADTIEGKFK